MRTWTCLTLLILIVAGGCSSSPGPDSLSNRKKHAREPVSACTECHNSLNSPSLDPLITNGSGTYGKHSRHFQDRWIACEACHYNYLNAPTHMNGVFDRGNPAVVALHVIGPAGTWQQPAGSCSGVACHGAAELFWYGTNTWTTPSSCTGCHASGFSSVLDPVATNGTPPAGRHGMHVAARAIGCERCHYQYPDRTSHANAVLDTPDPAVSLVRFDIVGTGAGWTDDTGSSTGRCATVSCHGSDSLAWYGAGTWSTPSVCTNCHSSAYSSQLDPVVTNGSGNPGKHVRHVTDYHYACTKCHLDYPDSTSHASGMLDTQNPAILIVSFDSTNPTGTWTGDTGSETGNCASLNCHGADTPVWYGPGGLSPLPACSSCHSNAIGTRRTILGANGDFGANAARLSHHVTPGPGSDPSTDHCLVCHEMTMHMGGTIRMKNADSGSAIAYNPGNPSTLETFCLSCHDENGALSTFISSGTPTAPFNDGSVLGNPPYSYAGSIKTSWTGTNGHGPNGQHAAADKLTCLGTGQQGTGCHGNNGSINAHGSGSPVLATRNFLYDTNDPFDENDYELCFNCHVNYAGVRKEDILGVKFQGILDSDYGWISRPADADCPAPCWYPPYYISAVTTLFADHNVPTPHSLNDPVGWGPSNMNLHWFHLGFPVFFRGTGSWSGLTCVNCHDVHGSSNPYGATYREMGYQHSEPDATNRTGKMTDAAYLSNLLDEHPTYCGAWNCHPIQGQTKAWYYPIVEGP